MKKLITLCLFAFAMFFGSQTLTAQNSKLDAMKKINATAAKKTESLRIHVKFGPEQRDDVYEALKHYGQSIANLEGKDVSAEENAKIEKQLDDKIKSILSEEQYELYKTFDSEN
ncbi:hypothetical protein [Winogradskyella endarachnes]|uniref:Peptidylprolyl isomerase n=1 Tax=Winogradskyella endarachnes TaxID=2681965 RepID=A0A6L6U9A1_9FLAO|nr:hypothetical protein [Winogradskyella endarachnes]MUU78910.1 hypothetical protein [Winogradskyella endarachnes]